MRTYFQDRTTVILGTIFLTLLIPIIIGNLWLHQLMPKWGLGVLLAIALTGLMKCCRDFIRVATTDKKGDGFKNGVTGLVFLISLAIWFLYLVTIFF